MHVELTRPGERTHWPCLGSSLQDEFTCVPIRPEEMSGCLRHRGKELPTYPNSRSYPQFGCPRALVDGNAVGRATSRHVNRCTSAVSHVIYCRSGPPLAATPPPPPPSPPQAVSGCLGERVWGCICSELRSVYKHCVFDVCFCTRSFCLIALVKITARPLVIAAEMRRCQESRV